MVVVHAPNRIHVFSCERRNELINMLNERI